MEPDLNFSPIRVTCIHCKKPKRDHKAVTFNCPVGLKARVVGYTQYSAVNYFTPKKPETEAEIHADVFNPNETDF